MLVGELLSLLSNVKGSGPWTARCPAHDDRSPSLSIRVGDDGRILVHCFVGCSVERIATALGVTLGDLFGDTSKPTDTGHGRGLRLDEFLSAKLILPEIAQQAGVTEVRYNGRAAVSFVYRAPDGAPLFTKIRCGLSGDRGFRVQPAGRKLVPYGLETLGEAGDEICVTEGETDALSLRAHGIHAIGIPGAASWNDEWISYFEDKTRIWLVPDNDAAGRQLVTRLKKSPLSDRIWVVDLPQGVKDVSELYLSDPDNFRLRWSAAVECATPITSWSTNSDPVADALKLAVAELARLELVEYELQRRAAAKKHNIRPTALDALVRAERSRNGQGATAAGTQPMEIPSLVPWPEPINGAALLEEIIVAIARFVFIGLHERVINALWAIYTHVYKQLDTLNPFLRIKSPTAECGKSTLEKATARMVAHPNIVSRISASALVRTVNLYRPTLFLDEADAYLHENEVARGIIDGAHDRETANVELSIKQGDNWVPTRVNVYLPICITSIGNLRGLNTVESRSFPIWIKRAPAAELRRLEKARKRTLDAVFGPLGRKAARWAADNIKAIQEAEVEFPDQLVGREQDCYEPLFKIASVAGGEWPSRVREAALYLSNKRENEDYRILLLGDIRELFKERDTDKLSSEEICEHLKTLEGRPWAEYGKRHQPISKNQLAYLLRGLDREKLTPGTIRTDGGTIKGYSLEQFDEVFAAYLDHEGAEKDMSPIHDGGPKRNNVTPQLPVGESDDSTFVTDPSQATSETCISPYGEKGCDVVTDRNTTILAEQQFPASEPADAGPSVDDILTTFASTKPGERPTRFLGVEKIGAIHPGLPPTEYWARHAERVKRQEDALQVKPGLYALQGHQRATRSGETGRVLLYRVEADQVVICLNPAGGQGERQLGDGAARMVLDSILMNPSNAARLYAQETAKMATFAAAANPNGLSGGTEEGN